MEMINSLGVDVIARIRLLIQCAEKCDSTGREVIVNDLRNQAQNSDKVIVTFTLMKVADQIESTKEVIENG